MQNSEFFLILPSQQDLFNELHVIPSFASITVHEEVVDLVVEIRLLERNEVLLAETH